MSRLPKLTHDDLDDDQRMLWRNLTTGPRANPDRPDGGLTDDDGALVGPFNALLYSPKIGDLAQELGGALRFGTGLPRDLQEIAICAVGAHWRANFEFAAHARMAAQQGIPQAAIDAIRDGQAPVFDDPRHEATWNFAGQLLRTGRVDQPAYDALHALLGDSGLYELTATMGYYCLVSLSLNVFQVPAPQGLPQPFPV